VSQQGIGYVLKRVLDVTAALVVLSLTWPVILIASAVIARQMVRPILFRQTRPGRHGVLFQIMKFRTMLEAVDSDGKPLPDADRLTPLGSFLRRSSIDELPQLMNVLRGEMSLVGPRPLLVQYLDRYSPKQSRRHDVLPGITGWSQVNGRNAISWPNKLDLDVWYVDNWSLFLDFKILIMTLLYVIRRDGISAKGHVGMPEFTGREALEHGEQP
jgi:lipopolysaccharide/colanic/teichoic acid biosynthesis glycosyltransferase